MTFRSAVLGGVTLLSFFSMPLVKSMPIISTQEIDLTSVIEAPSCLSISREGSLLNISWDATNDQTHYRVLLKDANGNFAPDLIISEYLEGSSLNKYLEIYNGTDRFIDLDRENYELLIYINPTKNGVRYPLNGVLAPKQTFVFRYQSSVLLLPDGVESIPVKSNFNGDDALELTRESNRVDLFGVIGYINSKDTFWQSSDKSVKARDQTIRRKPTILKGDAREFTESTFATALKNQWDPYPIDEVSDFGRHTMNTSYVKGMVVDGINCAFDEVSDGDYILSIVAFDPLTGNCTEEQTTKITLGKLEVVGDNHHTLESSYVESITVAEGATLVIPSGESVSTENISLSYSDKENSLSSPTLWVDGDFIVSGAVDVNLSLSAGKWHFISLPFDVDSMRVNDNSSPIQGVDIRICSYDTHARESNGGEISNFMDIIPLGTSGHKLSRGVGYILALPMDADIIMYVSDSTKQISLSNREQMLLPQYGGVNSDDLHNGWNLVGNPYIANLSRASHGHWLAWNGETYTLNGEINSLNSFFVQVDSSDPIVFIPEWCAISETSSYSNETASELVIEVSDGITSDACHLRLADTPREFYQVGHDMAKMFSLRSDVPQVYYSRWGYPMHLSDISLDELIEGITFEIRIASTGVHYLSVDRNSLDEMTELHLDLDSGESFELDNNIISINGIKGERIKGRVKASIKLDSNNQAVSKVSIIPRDGYITITGLAVGELVRLFDISGATIYSALTSSETLDLHIPRGGVYMIQISSESSVVNKRVWVSNKAI
ncbi:MAG: lamin tail domain-containing protein [Bacteroidales bacterium]